MTSTLTRPAATRSVPSARVLTHTPVPGGAPLCHDNVVPLRLPMPIAAVQGTLALDLQPRLEPPRVDPAELRSRHELEPWVWRYAQAAVEIVGGDRPVTQLLRWSSREVFDDLERRAVLVARAGGHQPGVARVQAARAKVLSVRCSFLEPDIAEVSIHVRHGRRSRALAARFERRPGRTGTRWLCTALEFA